MELKDLLPSKPEFKVQSKNKTYALRIPNLEDRARFRDMLGSDQEINRVFAELDWAKIAKLVYRLLEDKSDFLAVQTTIVDDDGVPQKALLTGPAVMMQAIHSIEEATAMLGALITALRNGDPLVDKALTAIDAEKKTIPSQTGDESLTKSQVNMDTPRTSLVS